MRDRIARRLAVIIIALSAFILGVAPQRAAAEQCYTFPQTRPPVAASWTTG